MSKFYTSAMRVKSPVYLLMLLVVSGFFNSCSNEVDVIGTWKEIPVVYGILEPRVDTNYIRIEKAFLDPDTDAFEIAKQRPDSLYYAEDEIEVLLYERIYDSRNLATTDSFRVIDTLQRVDANTLGFQREDGIFASSPNYIYISDNRLEANFLVRYYKLEIRNLKSGKVFSQVIQSIKPGEFDPSENTFGEFSITTPSRSREVTFVRIEPSGDFVFDEVQFNWEQPLNAAIYDLSILFGYYEYEVDGNDAEIPGTRVYKELTWKPVRNFMAEGSSEISSRFGDGSEFGDGVSFYKFNNDNIPPRQDLRGESFFTFLRDNLSDVTGTNIRRCAATTFDIRVDAAGPELAEYLQAQAINDGLVGGLFPADPFTNIDEGYGLFTHRLFSTKQDMDWDEEMFEYLRFGDLAQGLGFQNNIGCN